MQAMSRLGGSRTLGYDAAGRITGFTQSNDAGQNESFGYDAADRLTA